MHMKSVFCIGHRDKWRCQRIESKLESEIEKLIIGNYCTFYIANDGAFNMLCKQTLLFLKSKYPHIQIIKVINNYDPHFKTAFLKYEGFDDFICPTYDKKVYYKALIIERNRWMIDHVDTIICHIENTYKSGAYTAIKYAIKQNKEIIYL